jgi:hypothetical protein
VVSNPPVLAKVLKTVEGIQKEFSAEKATVVRSD